MNKKGITLIELIIVLAVLAILAAVLIPNFFNVTDRARLRSDIQSARVINNAMELYRIENNKALPSSVTDILKELKDGGYLSNKNTDTQTAGADWKLDNNKIVVFVGGASDNVKNIAKNLSPDEQEFVQGF